MRILPPHVFAIGFGELPGYVVPLAFLIVIDRSFIPIEEKAMQRVFGAP